MSLANRIPDAVNVHHIAPKSNLPVSLMEILSGVPRCEQLSSLSNLDLLFRIPIFLN